MNSSYTNKETLLSATSHSSVSRQWHLPALLLSLLLLAGGATLIFTTLSHADSQRQTLDMGLLTAGTFLLMAGCYLLAGKSKRLVYTPTGSPIQEQTLYFDRPCTPALHRILEGDFETSDTMKPTSHGSVRLTFVKSADGRFAGAQLASYESYLYVPITPAYYFTELQAEALNRHIARIKASSQAVQ